VFNLNINGPFEIVKTKTNSGAQHPLSNQSTIKSAEETKKDKEEAKVATNKKSKVVKQKVETMFCL